MKQRARICVIEQLFNKMAATKVQDARVLATSAPDKIPSIIEAVSMTADGSTGNYLLFAENRSFAVHDPLTLN